MRCSDSMSRREERRPPDIPPPSSLRPDSLPPERTAMAQTMLTLAVTGMHCGACGLLIDDTLADLPGVHSATTDVRGGRTTVTVDTATTDVGQLIAAVTAAGYTPHRCRDRPPQSSPPGPRGTHE